MATARFKTFTASLSKFWLAACPFILTAGFLIYYGASNINWLHKMAPHLDATLVAPYWGAVILGAILFVLVLLVLLLNSRKSVTIAPEGIICKAGAREVKMAWRDCYPVFPGPDKVYMRTIIIEGGQASTGFKIEEFFFPDFDLLSDLIMQATQNEHGGRATKAGT